MALTQCPECSRDISDQVKACPHCGYPFVGAAEGDADKPQPVEVTAIKIGNPRKTKRIVTAIIVVVLFAIAAIVTTLAFKAKQEAEAKATAEAEAAAARSAYIDNLVLLQVTAISGGAEAEGLGNLARSVWYNTIYEESDSQTDKYTKKNKVFYDDFNDSLATLYSAATTKSTIQSIESNQTEVSEIMRDLQNPTEEFKACYDTANALYESYQGLTGLAVSPSGNLASYTENFRKYDEDLMKYYNKLDTQIPEK